SVTIFGGANQFNGDLSKNLFLNDKWKFGAGAMVTRQWTRVIGTRFKFGWAPLTGTVAGKFVPGANPDPSTGLAGDYVNQTFTSYVLEGDLHATINFVNWIAGYKPERFFSSYLILGVGMDHTQGSRVNDLDLKTLGYLGYPTHKGPENLGVGNNSGIGKWNLEFKGTAGLGFDFNLNQHWSINPEILWRWRDGDVLDLTPGGVKEVKNDMYSGVNLGLTYKFAYGGCSIKQMEKDYALVKYETTPAVLTEKGDSVAFTVKGTFPPKYFCPKAVMVFEPVLKYEGGTYKMKPMTMIGEKITGDGTMIKYKEGGSFTYTTVFPYKPEMAVSELVVAPLIYDAKDKVIPNTDDVKVKVKYAILPERSLAPGIIHTPTRIALDMIPALAEHGYQKEVIVNKVATLYFRINLFKLEPKFGLNKTTEAQDALTQLNAFVLQGWKIKNITIDGWASPDGEETFNVGLSENRAKTGNTYMMDQFKNFVKESQKANKNRKEVKAKIDSAGKDVNFVVQSHGPDWNGFLNTIKASDIKDKDKIMNVINSAGDNLKKEQEIRNMIVIYPEIEEKMLPPLRRAEITANLYEPRRTDADLSRLAISNPDSLKVEELLYAATLTTNNDTKITIYENAARLYPESWKAHNNAANANLVKGNLDAAAAHLQKANAQAPNNGIVENNLGVLYAKQRDYVKAEDHFKKAQKLGENENYNLGVLMIPKGDYAKANSMLANSKCTYNLGLAQLVSGDNTAAQTTLMC
ncbi:MAG TPA: hypothetical protein VLR52_03040, partial [Bacteroidales bacterium]|nr:hypothetical protein [Bacteroidales bacterium]